MLNHGTLRTDGSLSLDDLVAPIPGALLLAPALNSGTVVATSTEAIITCDIGGASNSESTISDAAAFAAQVTQEASSPFVIDAILDSSITNLAVSSPTLYAEITNAITTAIRWRCDLALDRWRCRVAVAGRRTRDDRGVDW